MEHTFARKLSLQDSTLLYTVLAGQGQVKSSKLKFLD